MDPTPSRTWRCPGGGHSVARMRNLFSGVVNWIAALFAVNGGAPHPIVSTDLPASDGEHPATGSDRPA